MQKGDWQAISSLFLFLPPVHFACFEEGLIGPHSKQTPGRATGLGVPACHMQVSPDSELLTYNRCKFHQGGGIYSHYYKLQSDFSFVYHGLVLG